MTRVVCLPGDGIGAEVAGEALRVLAVLPLDVEVETRAGIDIEADVDELLEGLGVA